MAFGLAMTVFNKRYYPLDKSVFTKVTAWQAGGLLDWAEFS
jgi:hypothetical protein